MTGCHSALRLSGLSLAVVGAPCPGGTIHLAPLVAQWYALLMKLPRRTPQQEDFMMHAHHAFNEFQELARQEGRLQGRKEGRQEGRVQGRQEGRVQGRQEEVRRLFERRLGRRLRSHESRSFVERIGRLGLPRLEDIVLELDSLQLAAWLADPDAS